VTKLTHTDSDGRANMVDVGSKTSQLRIAQASGKIKLAADTVKLIRDDQMKKGDVLAVAQIAGIQAAKNTASLIPLCHPIITDKIGVRLELVEDGVIAKSEVRCIGRTGVEMEALTAVSLALLCIYDMCKAVDKKMVIENIKLTKKEKHDV
jgi:cyclic pyranopterin phosphate synthase